MGTELLLGQIVDTNSSWIGEQLALAGIDTYFQTKVGDNWDRIRSWLELALERSDAVVVCGGLGPTQDDITREVIADVMGVELVLDPVIEERIRNMFGGRGRHMPENNLRQAMVPEGASTIPQQPGTAPGLICPIGDKVIFAVPGVPYEMQEMVAGTVVPDLQRRAGVTAVIRSRVLRTWGQSESGLAEMLAPRFEELDQSGHCTIAFLASGMEGLKVRITAKAETEAEAEAVLDDEVELLRGVLGELIFSENDESMEEVVLQLLRERGLTMATAESVTGRTDRVATHRRARRERGLPGQRGFVRVRREIRRARCARGSGGERRGGRGHGGRCVPGARRRRCAGGHGCGRPGRAGRHARRHGVPGHRRGGSGPIGDGAPAR